MDNFASLDTPQSSGGVKVVEWNQNQLFRSLWMQVPFRDIEYLRRTMLCYHLLLLLSSYSEVTVVVPDAFPGWMPSQINLKPAWERRGEWGLEHMVLNYPLRIIHLLLVYLLGIKLCLIHLLTYIHLWQFSRRLSSWQNANNSSNVLWPLYQIA